LHEDAFEICGEIVHGLEKIETSRAFGRNAKTAKVLKLRPKPRLLNDWHRAPAFGNFLPPQLGRKLKQGRLLSPIGGKVEKIADKLVYLSQLTGTEYYNAVVDTTDVSAVVVRRNK